MSGSAIRCERAIEVEDLVLGLSVDPDLEAHLATCADCNDARVLFEEERSLFAARPRPEPPPLALPRPAIQRVAHLSWVPAVAAMAACMAAFLGHAHRADDCDTPAPIATVVATAATHASDEPAICREPSSFGLSSLSSFNTFSSEPAPAVSIASHDMNACVPSPTATCDVTSSLAMP